MMKKLFLLLLFALPAIAQTHSATLSWTPSTSVGVTGVNVYRAPCTGTVTGGVGACSAVGTFVKLTSSPVAVGITTYVDTAVVAGAAYDYYVTAFCPTCTPATESVPSTHWAVAIPSSPGGGYSTAFSNTENPLSEGGVWLVPGTIAPQWGNVQSSSGLAFGASQPTQYGDPTGTLTGTWPADQQAQATIKVTTVPATCCHEVELHLRFQQGPASLRGYELMCPVWQNPNYGMQVVRWNGPNGSYSYLPSTGPGTNTTHQCVNGDVLKGTVSGTNPVTINYYLNGVLMITATDNGGNYSPGGAAGPWTNGNPGIGFYDSADNSWSNFGFSQFSAQNSGALVAPASPTGLSVTAN